VRAAFVCDSLVRSVLQLQGHPYLL